ncbi:MAG: EcsC family protein [Oscillospiraceae bacterium]|nr:EcsC family protein [Oscillospiraceae bacterium]
MKPEQIEHEMKRVISAENTFMRMNTPDPSSLWQKPLERYIPAQLQNTLYAAFCKAFTLILDNGTMWIEKTYNAEKIKEDYQIHQYASAVRKDKNGMSDFRKNVRKSKYVNSMISAAEGIGMGALGIGLADIPLLLAVLLRSVYEIALQYGFSYDSEEEQVFILRLMETALLHGDELDSQNAELNRLLYAGKLPEISRSEQIKRTSGVLAADVLFLKFIQGIPVVGMVGGVSDIVCHKKITDYAELKYRRRFLHGQM